MFAPIRIALSFLFIATIVVICRVCVVIEVWFQVFDEFRACGIVLWTTGVGTAGMAAIRKKLPVICLTVLRESDLSGRLFLLLLLLLSSL